METKRKGARSFKELQPSIMEKLNQGMLESVNLTEWLAVDQPLLLKNFLESINRTNYLAPILSEIDQLKKKSVNTYNVTIGKTLIRLIDENNDREIFSLMSSHLSDTIRCWAAYVVGHDAKLSTNEVMEQIRPFAADSHFGVREISWMAVRHIIIKDLDNCIEILQGWTNADDENVRRFASESTRPRGVWCEHIEALKLQPEKAIALLEPLKNDSSKYVRDSVGNWLNDAAKTQPHFVKDLCSRWEKESSTKETAYIVKKALRSL